MIDRLEATAVPGGTRLRLRVHAAARKAEWTVNRRGELKISVTTVPERGKANRAVLKRLARLLEIPLTSIEIVSGTNRSEKTVVVPLEPRIVRERLQSPTEP